MTRFAVVSVSRKNGEACTMQVFDDATRAQNLANILNRDIYKYRCAVIPFDAEEKND